jgi:hypothetical protein
MPAGKSDNLRRLLRVQRVLSLPDHSECADCAVRLDRGKHADSGRVKVFPGVLINLSKSAVGIR